MTESNSDKFGNFVTSTMMIFFILCSSIQQVAAANYKDHNNDRITYVGSSIETLTPNNVGLFHNKMMTQIHDKIALHMPSSFHDYAKIVEEEVLSACGVGDISCYNHVKQVSMQSREYFEKSYRSDLSVSVKSMIPSEFHDHEAMKDLENIHEVVLLIHNHPLDHVTNKLDSLMGRVDSSDASYEHKLVVQGTVSIAKGSTAYWLAEFGNPDSAFHRLIEERDAKKGTLNPNEFVSQVVIQDVLAFANGFLMNSFYIVIVPSLGIAMTILYAALESGIRSGFTAFFYGISSDFIFCFVSLLGGEPECFYSRWGWLMEICGRVLSFVNSLLTSN